MKLLTVSVAFAIAVIGGASIHAADSDAQYPGIFVIDSAITVKVKSKLLAKHPALLSNVQVQTDRDGNVWLSGTVPTKEAKRLAEEIASETSGVKAVHNHIVVSP